MGSEVGVRVGLDVGSGVEVRVGLDVGSGVGVRVGLDVGSGVGVRVGLDVGVGKILGLTVLVSPNRNMVSAIRSRFILIGGGSGILTMIIDLSVESTSESTSVR